MMITNKQRNIVTRLLMVVGALAILVIPALNKTAPTAAAGSVQLALSPASQSVTTGSNVVVNVVANTGGASINTVQSVLSYSASQFSLVGIVPGGAFGSFPTPMESSGSVQFSAASTSAVTSNQTVATITLKANSAGTSSVSLAGICPAGNFALTCSAAYDSVTSSNDLGSIANASYTVTNPVVTPPSSGSSGGSSGSTAPAATSTKGTTSTTNHSTSSGNSAASVSSPASSSSASAPASSGAAATPAASNPAPAISGVQVINTSTNNTTITWQTDIPATSVVNYGLNTNYGLTDQSSNLTTNHSVTLNPSNLTQSTTYYFVVASASSTGASSTSAPQQLTTAGFSVTIRIVDKHGKPIAGVKVTLHGQTAISNKDGAVSFQNVPAGKQTVTVHASGAAVQHNLTVGSYNAKTGSYQQQQFSLTAARGSNLAWLYVLIGLLVVLGALVVLVGPARLANLLRRLTSFGKPPTSGDSSGASGPTSGTTPSNPVVTPGSTPSAVTATPVLPVVDAPTDTHAAAAHHDTAQPTATMATSLERLHAPHGPEPGTIFRPSSR